VCIAALPVMADRAEPVACSRKVQQPLQTAVTPSGRCKALICINDLHEPSASRWQGEDHLALERQAAGGFAPGALEQVVPRGPVSMQK
jgi:hypothetical protein